MAVLATAMSASLYAADTTASQSADNASVQAQIAQLQKDIAKLQAQQQQMQNQTEVAAPSSGVSGANGKEVTVPTNMGEIQNFLFSDVTKGVVPMGMLSSSQFALGLLKQRNNYSDKALVFGGYLEADAQAWNGSTITRATQTGETNPPYTYQSGRGIYITTANLYTAANLGRYVTTELTLSADQVNDPSVSDALVIFGNLADFPLYATVGKNRIPFGSFAGGGPWTGSLTQMLFRPSRESNVSVNYYKDGLSTNLTLFQTTDHSSNFAYAVFYGGEHGKWSYGANGGYLYNVNGSGNSSFDVATGGSANTKRIGAVNFEGSLNYDIYGVGAGWAQATNKSDMTNNGYAGAWYVSAGLSPVIYGRSTNFALSYNGAYNTNNLPITLSGSAPNGYTTVSSTSGTAATTPSAVTIPGSGVNKMVIASAQRPFFTENVLVGLEYAYMHMYNGQHSNAYTVDLSVYF